jgi:outer membrane protein insertion porin family
VKKVIQKILFIIGLVFTIQSASAESFVVKQIRVMGLQRVQESTVLSYLPIHIGQTLTTQDTINILKTLYKTGFFTDVRLSRQGGTLIVTVAERPTIGLIQIQGNKEFTDKQLQPVLKDLGIAEGLPYDSSKVNAITQGLREQYNQLGYYAVQVRAVATPEPRNRVALFINVKEGPIAKIRRITIIGNDAFKTRAIKKIFASKTTAWWKLSFLVHNDRYSKVLIAKDLDQLRTFYYNHGYLRFQVIDQQTVVSPDNKTVDITITIKEGPVYTIKDYQLLGLEAYSEDARVLRSYLVLLFKPGVVFSKQAMLTGAETIRVYFASKGHAFPVIDTDPSINDSTHQVTIIYTVSPGPISYVRFIDFTGNTRTVDTALRNRVSQMEGAPYSIVEVEQSKGRLAYLPYLQDVSVDTNPVSHEPDQVDLNYHVKEVNAGKASIQGGFSTSDGWIYGASLSEPNLFGTGKYGSLSFNSSEYQKSYSLTYVDPYYTPYGISRSITIFSTITTPSEDLNYSSYSMDGYGATVTYGIPITLNNRINLGGGYTYIVLHDIDDTSGVAPPVEDFVEDHPSPYNQFKGIASWSYSTLDRAVMPTRGLSQLLGLELGLPVMSNSLSYYRLTEEFKYYHPLWYGFIFAADTSLGFGDGYGNVDTLPFFNNFYAGGIETLPGYASNSLGPTNPNQGNGHNAALGGNLRLLGGLNLILPTFIPKVRTALTFDAGNIWDTNRVDANKVEYEDVSFRNVRMSAGVMVIWYSPMGPLQFSAAKAINAQSTDQVGGGNWFGFAFGASI